MFRDCGRCISFPKSKHFEHSYFALNFSGQNDWEITLTLEIWCFKKVNFYVLLLTKIDKQPSQGMLFYSFSFLCPSVCVSFLALGPTTLANNHTGGERGFHFPSGGNKHRHCTGGSWEHYSARQENHHSPWWVAISWQLANVGILLCSYSALCFSFACGIPGWQEIHDCYDALHSFVTWVHSV